MVSTTLTAQPSREGVMMENRRMEELSVAEALMGVPSADMKVKSASVTLDSYASLESLAEQAQAIQSSIAEEESPQKTTSGAVLSHVPSMTAQEPSIAIQPEPTKSSAPRTGLDALAALALEKCNAAPSESLEPYLAVSGVVSSAPTSSDEESDPMPPPPPRRRRSASNPEGMEKWDSLSRARGIARRHFVLPAAILEEELAEANAAVRERELLRSEQKQNDHETQPNRSNLEEADESEDCTEKDEDKEEEREDEEEEEDESMLTPEELLRKARSRLLEDLSEGSINGEKGQLMLPHALGKYKSVYNQNGRIGIYTPAERAAIIARFNEKRQRRVWNKKIRYNCRKSLADRRLRVKGRFVKRSEQEQLAREIQARVEQKVAEETATSKNGDGDEKDADMPDVTDPEAGFAPTEEQPYRRLRRYTIT